MSYEHTLTTMQAFERYEAVRHRFPSACFPLATQSCTGLLDVADHFDAFVLDSFGVLNTGDTAIAGAVACLSELRRRNKRLIVLTNAASYTRKAAIARYARLGFEFSAHEVISSRDVATARLETVLPGGRWGAIAASDDAFEDIATDVVAWTGQAVDGFLLLSSANLDAKTVEALQSELSRAPRPFVVANPDLVAPREGGLSKEPGFYAHQIADALGGDPVFFGKPFVDAYNDAIAALPGIAPERIAMVGDTLHTDILGGASAGMKTILVRDHGLFAGHDVDPFIRQCGIVPDFSCPTI